MLRMLKYTLNRQSLIKIYFSFIRPILEYANSVWDNCTEREANLLENVQVTAARIITGMRINSSRSALYNELGWDTLATRRKVHKLILFYKIAYGIAPQYLQELLIPCIPPQNSYPLRNNDGLKFIPPQLKTSSYMNSFIPSAIKLWNDLPIHIRNLPTLASFKTAIKNMYYKKPNKLFNHGKRQVNILHCQIRNNASNLNFDLHCHFLRDNATCDMCGHPTENAFHFFFECVKFSQQRFTLIESINEMHLEIPISLKMLLSGNEILKFKDNVKIFEYVQKYILDCKRFDTVH